MQWWLRKKPQQVEEEESGFPLVIEGLNLIQTLDIHDDMFICLKGNFRAQDLDFIQRVIKSWGWERVLVMRLPPDGKITVVEKTDELA